MPHAAILLTRPYLKYPLSSFVAGKIVCAAIFCLALVAAAQIPEEDTESLRTGTDLVQADVMVFDRRGNSSKACVPNNSSCASTEKCRRFCFSLQVKAGTPDEERKISGSTASATTERTPMTEAQAVAIENNDRTA